MAFSPEDVWNLIYDPRIRRQLEKIRNKNVIRRIQESAVALCNNPYSGKTLRGYPGVRSKRIGTPEGEYRLIYRLIEEKREVFIVLVGPREAIYELLERKSL